MKHLLLAAPLGLLLVSGAFAQTTEGATDGATGGETSTMQSGSLTYGMDWSDSVGSAFYNDAERTMLRSTDEIAQQWPSLAQEDRDKVLAECARFKTDSNATDLTDGSSDATAGTGMDSIAGTATGDTATTGTATTGTDTGTATGTGTGTGMTAGYDLNAMMVICPAVENL